MDFAFELFTKKEIMIIGVVIGALVLIVLILTLIDILSKRKEKEALEDMLNEFDRIEPIKKKNTVNVDIHEDKKEDFVETKELENNRIVVEKIEEVPVENHVNKEIIIENVNKEEIKSIPETKKIEYIEPIIIDIDDGIDSQELNKNRAQDELLKIEEELQNPKSLEDTLYNLEIMEEENAIISYQELVENTSELNTIESDSGDEPISLKEILNMYDKNTEIESLDVDKEMSKTTLNEAYKGDFTSSPYLSPIVGFDYDESKSCDLAEIQLENTANLEKLDKEMRKTNEFLSILNDLKKNLD